ncbi:hypothetical protein V8E36_009339 [Tilletia maclaganii]
MRVQNQDQRTHGYTDRTLDLYPRPSHANYTYLQRYGVKASAGGGRQLLRADLPSLLLTAALFLQQLFLPVKSPATLIACPLFFLPSFSSPFPQSLFRPLCLSHSLCASPLLCAPRPFPFLLSSGAAASLSPLHNEARMLAICRLLLKLVSWCIPSAHSSVNGSLSGRCQEY